MTELSAKISEVSVSFNPFMRSSFESFSVNSENQFENEIPNIKKVQNDINTKNAKVLISRELVKYVDPEKLAVVKIQSFIRMKLAVERYKLKRLHKFRAPSIKLIAKGGKKIDGVLYFILIFRTKKDFFIKVKNLITGALFYTEITAENYIFGYLKTGSFRLICRSLIIHEGLPAFEYKKRINSSVNLQISEFYLFKKLNESISLHQAAFRIKSLFKAIKLRKMFKFSKDRKIYHSVLYLKQKKYRVAVHLRKGYILIEVYSLKKEKNEQWIHSKRVENKDIIQKYGEINPAMLVKEIRISEEGISLGLIGTKENFQMQKHISFVFNEVLMEEKLLNKSFKSIFMIETYLRTYKNAFLDSAYSVICFECYLPREIWNVREVSIQLENASEVLGIPVLWVHPIAYFIRKKCLKVTSSQIGLNVQNKKLDLDKMAEKIQNEYRKYRKSKMNLRIRRNEKKKTLRYRLSLLIKS